jgi:hypothetical protein
MKRVLSLLAFIFLTGCVADQPPKVLSHRPEAKAERITQADAIRIVTQRWAKGHTVLSNVEASIDQDEWVVEAESRDARRGDIILIMRLDLKGNWINDGSCSQSSYKKQE